MSDGIKDDGLGAGRATVKPRWDLVPYQAQAVIVDVLTYGAEKYEPDNWRKVDGWRWRYFRAGVGHLVDWWMGEERDQESGLPHLAHAACCVLFLLGKELEEGLSARYFEQRQQYLYEAVTKAREAKAVREAAKESSQGTLRSRGEALHGIVGQWTALKPWAELTRSGQEQFERLAWVLASPKEVK